MEERATVAPRERFPEGEPDLWRKGDPPAAGEIHLWLADYGAIGDEGLLGEYRELLDDTEKAQEPRFHFARDRRRYVVTRALVRSVLSRYLSIGPRECRFATNAYGRPDIVNRQATEISLSFNLSHTHSLIVLGVARGRSLGVDVENIRAREVSIGIADRYFAPEEVRTLSSAPRHEQQYRFFEYWTFKESYIKARGLGLSLPLDKFRFDYPGERSVAIAVDPELKDDAARWQFWQFRPSPEYLVAVCAERSGPLAPAVVVRETVPLMSERPCAPELLRVSG